MHISNKILSDLVVFTKYAKYNEAIKRRETWDEIVNRNMQMHIKKHPNLKKEIQTVYKDFVFNKKVLPSMRSLQFGGKPIEISPNRQYNCAYLPVDSIYAFSETMFLLLGGSGVGYSVQFHHVNKLPEIIGVKKRNRRFLVSDTIEGWADAVRVLLEAYFYNKSNPIFDFSDIRPKGARLVTSGGKAPGHKPLKYALEHIKDILDQKEIGSKLTPLEAHDIQCYIADAVLAGGIRRAALIAGFSLDDEEMLDCKSSSIKSEIIRKESITFTSAMGLEIDATKLKVDIKQGDKVYKNVILRADESTGRFFDLEQYERDGTLGWWVCNPQRGRANNSAVILRHKIKKREFNKLWKRVVESGSGEPGIYFSNDKDWFTNPCVETALRPHQFCVSGDTRLITRDGLVNIEDTVDKNIEIWNGEEWSMVKPYKTGDSDRLHRVWFSDGSYLDATDNHKFLVKNRFENEFKEVDTIELIELLKNSKYNLQVPRSNIKYYDEGIEENKAYDYGFILGDGFVYKKNKYVEANLFNKDKLLEFETAKYIGEYLNYNDSKFTTIRFDVDYDFSKKLKYENGLPKEIFSWDRYSILKFIAGWADADGSNASKGIRIYGREDKLRDGQLLLTKLGINSSLNLMSKKGEFTNLGERKNDVWYLQITRTIDIPCQRLICENDEDCKFKGKYQLIRKIDTLDGTHKSYCLTEDKLHQCVFNNVLTKQCNLTEINASTIEDQQDFNERATAAAFIGTIQASYTDFHYLRDSWKESTEKDALIGVGITGIASGNILDLDSEEAASYVLKENERMAEVLGINKAARTTVIKPSGTSSMVLGCSSGIHAWHNDFYIRRMRLGKDESIYKYLIENHPEIVKDEKFKPDLQAVVEIPQSAPEGSILRTETMYDLLERIKKFNTQWVHGGHRDGQNTHNVSATVSVKEDQWKDCGEWLWENRESFNGMSVLPYDGGTYVQAPFEDITEEKYNEMVKHLHSIDLTKVIEEEDNTNLSGEIACAGGKCEI